MQVAENRAGDGERPTVEQSAPVRDAPTVQQPPGPGRPSPPPPRLPLVGPAPGAPPPLPPVPMEAAVGLAPRTVVLIAVLAALAGALVTAALFLVVG